MLGLSNARPIILFKRESNKRDSITTPIGPYVDDIDARLDQWITETNNQEKDDELSDDSGGASLTSHYSDSESEGGFNHREKDNYTQTFHHK